MTTDSYLADYGVDNIVRAARKDFRGLHYTEPVPVLNAAEWKARIAMQLGFNGKNAPLS